MSSVPRRWVSWAAVSSLPQAKKISIADQLQINREHCTKHGGQLVAELVVPGESRSIVLFEDAARRIDAYAELHRLINAKAFDVLVYLDASRLGRIDALVMSVRALCRQADIICYETDNPPVTLDSAATYDDDLLSAIKAVSAQNEVRKLSARQASGLVGRAKSGLVPGQMCYGYVIQWQQISNQTLPRYVIDANAAAVVRNIFTLYLNGQGTPSIAATLTAQGIPSPAGFPAWSREMVVNVIDHVWRYAGYVELNVISRTRRPYLRTPGQWDAIIDELTLHAVLTERQARNANRKLADARHTLTGVCFCRVCGGPMSLHRATNWGKPTDYVRCYRHMPSVNARTVNVIDAIRTLINALPSLDLDALLVTDDTSATAIDAQIAEQHKAIAAIAAAIERADTAYVDGRLDADRYTTQIDRLKAQRANAVAELDRLTALAASEAQRSSRRHRAIELATRGLAMLDGANPTAANAWLRHHLKVWVSDIHTIDIELI